MAKYSDIKISGGDTDEPINLQRRVRVAARFLSEHPCRLLDCGCGSGGYVEALDTLPHIRAYGLEFEASKVRRARRRIIASSRVVQGDIQTMPYADNSFDAVLLNEVLEHVPDQNRGLKEVNRVLRPGGRLLVFSPNRFYPFETHGVILLKGGKRIPIHTPFIPWIPLPLGEKFLTYPARNYWPGELRELLKAHGFEIIETDFIWQTFEGTSGTQPTWIRNTSGLLRKLSMTLEKVPLIKGMGVSQFIAATKR